MSDNVSRFGLVFYSSTEQAQAGLNKLNSMFGQMNASLAGLNATAGEAFSFLKSKILGIGEELFSNAVRIEKVKAEFKFAFRDMADQADDVFQKTYMAGLHMVQTTSQVTEMVTQMKRLGNVNIFDPKMDEAMKRTNKEGLQFIDLLGDMAAVNMGGSQGVTWGIVEMLTGRWRGGMRLNLSVEEIHKIRKATQSLHTQTEKLAAMAPILFTKFGGAARAMSNTWDFLYLQVKDFKEKILSNLGMPLVEAFKPLLRATVEYFVGDNGLVSQKRIHELDGLKIAIGRIGDTVTKIVAPLGRVTGLLIDVATKSPGIVEVGLALSGVLMGVTALIGAMVTLKVTTIAATIAFNVFRTTFLPFALVTGTLVLAVALAAQFAVHGRGISDTVYRWGVVIQGVSEGIRSLKGELFTLTAETARSAGEQGTLGLILQIVAVVYRAKTFFESMIVRFRENFGVIKESFMPVVERILGIFGLSDTKTADWASSGRRLADILTTVITKFAWALDKAVAFAQVMWDWRKAIMAVGIAWKANNMINGIAGISGIAGGGVGAVAGGAGGATGLGAAARYVGGMGLKGAIGGYAVGLGTGQFIAGLGGNDTRAGDIGAAIGGGIGTLIGGPLGTVIGGVIGKGFVETAIAGAGLVKEVWRDKSTYEKDEYGKMDEDAFIKKMADIQNAIRTKQGHGYVGAPNTGPGGPQFQTSPYSDYHDRKIYTKVDLKLDRQKIAEALIEHNYAQAARGGEERQ